MSNMSTSQLLPYVPYLKFYALAATGVQAGMMICMSYPTIPSLLQLHHNASLLAVWSSIYHKGKASMPPLVITSSAAFATLAYTLGSTPYAVAGLVSPCLIPFTLTVMRGNLTRLLGWSDAVGVNNTSYKAVKKGEEEEEEEEEGEDVGVLDVNEVRAEIDRWGALNIVRAMFPLTGFAVGLWATVG